MRFTLAFTCMLLLAGSSVAQERDCPFRSEWRGNSVETYLADVHACLNAPLSEIWFDADLEAEILERVNEARLEQGLPGLLPRPELLPAARIHSFDMGHESFFGHEGRDGREVGARVALLDRTLVFSEVRENVAAIGGDLDMRDAGYLLHKGLMDSSGHRKNILAERVTHIAIGVARADRAVWLTQVFVAEVGEFPEATQPTLSLFKKDIAIPTLNDWAFREFQLKLSDGEEHVLGALETNVFDEAQLRVVGQRPKDENTIELINLFGPAVTLVRVPASEIEALTSRPDESAPED